MLSWEASVETVQPVSLFSCVAINLHTRLQALPFCLRMCTVGQSWESVLAWISWSESVDHCRLTCFGSHGRTESEHANRISLGRNQARRHTLRDWLMLSSCYWAFNSRDHTWGTYSTIICWLRINRQVLAIKEEKYVGLLFKKRRDFSVIHIPICFKQLHALELTGLKICFGSSLLNLIVSEARTMNGTISRSGCQRFFL